MADQQQPPGYNQTPNEKTPVQPFPPQGQQPYPPQGQQPYPPQGQQPYPPQGQQPYPPMGQQPMMGQAYPAQPVVYAQPMPPGSNKLENDQILMQKLNSIEKYHINQGNPWLEGLTLGIWPNSYVISDAGRTVPIIGHKKGKQAPVPVFIVQEESNCCSRMCCPGNQPLLAHVWHARPEVHAGQDCCGCEAMPRYIPDAQAGVAMTLERDGCCSRWLGCFVCCEFCQNDMYMHAGNVSTNPGLTKPGDSTYFARSVMPIGGGGCVPTFELFVRDGVANKMGADGQEEPFGYSQGPTCFGGWLSACRDTIFGISAEKGRRLKPDYAEIRKQRADDCNRWCQELCTKVDHYSIDTTDKFKELSPEAKMAILGNVLHLDYAFFENDPPPCYVEGSDDSAVLICTLCLWYCWGCAWPIQICIPLGGGDS